MNAENLCSSIQTIAPAPTTLARELLQSWKDREYRFLFVRERLRSSIALQIRALREQRNGMTQTELARRMGKEQPWISQLENPEYGKMSVSTLLDCAEAFDTDIEIKFRPFSRSLDELTKQGTDYFEVPSFQDELPTLESAAYGIDNSHLLGLWSQSSDDFFQKQINAIAIEGKKKPVKSVELKDAKKNPFVSGEQRLFWPDDSTEKMRFAATQGR